MALAPELSVGGEKSGSDGTGGAGPRNDPLGAKSVSGETGGVYPGIIRRGTRLVASVGGGGFAVCDMLTEGDAPSSP